MTCSRWRRAIDRVRVVGGDDLALLGELEPAVDRARRLPEDRPVRRSAAAADRAATAVEQRQLDALARRDLDERLLGPMEHPGRRQEARFLVRVRVAEHHLLAIAARGEVGAVGRVAEHRLEDRTGRVQGLGRLEQRHDVEHRRRIARRRAGPASRTSVTSLADEVKLTTTRRQASTPKRAWIAAIDRNVAVTSSSGTPGETSAERSAAAAPSPSAARAARCTTACWRISSDARWNPNVPDLPAQVGDLAPRDALEAVGEQRLLELGELRVELVGRLVAPGQRAPARRSAPRASGAAARR